MCGQILIKSYFQAVEKVLNIRQSQKLRKIANKLLAVRIAK